MPDRFAKRFKIIIPYRGSEHSVVVRVSEWPANGILPVTLPDGSVVHIEKSELDLLLKCGMAEEVP